jgi:hypothetical protein
MTTQKMQHAQFYRKGKPVKERLAEMVSSPEESWQPGYDRMLLIKT